MADLHCSPSRFDIGQKHGTCLTRSELQKVAASVNVDTSAKTSTKNMVKSIKKQLGPKCPKETQETCLLQNLDPSVRFQILSQAYRPEKPRKWLSDPKTWLNTYDILNVMNQYEARYKSFRFFGVYPIDFTDRNAMGQCIGDSLCFFNLREFLATGKKRFAVVLNLDKHTQGGSHWVALYCDVDKRSKQFGIYYYDSIGYKPDLYNREKYVTKFMDRICNEVATIWPNSRTKFQCKYNKIPKQFQNTECGVFSQVFITQMLKGIPFEDICQRMPTDGKMVKIRDVLYRPPDDHV